MLPTGFFSGHPANPQDQPRASIHRRMRASADTAGAILTQALVNQVATGTGVPTLVRAA
jgi:hypothetical protein